ncbi:hypothetical protein ACFQV8_27770 [Pseudonocardia benzenivorans]
MWSRSPSRSCHQATPAPASWASTTPQADPYAPPTAAPASPPPRYRTAATSCARRLRRAAPSARRPAAAPVRKLADITDAVIGTMSREDSSQTSPRK